MKTRLDRLLCSALLCCALAMTPGSASCEAAVPERDIPAPVYTAEAPESTDTAQESPAPTLPAASDPTPIIPPAAEPSTQSSAEPSAAPSSEATLLPTSAPSAEATISATSTPSAAPTPSPSLAPSPESTPEAEATAAPTPRPTALPEHIENLLSITLENGTQQEDGSWHIERSEDEAALAFAWTACEGAQGYSVYLQADADSMRLIGESSEARIDLPAADFGKGTHVLYVGALLADGGITWESIRFTLTERQSGGSTGSHPGGASTKGEDSPQEQGLHVTPGEALTDKHASGTKNSAAYAASALPASGEVITALILSSTQSRIILDGGAAFYTSLEDAALHLIPEAGSAAWQLNVLALNTLAESGVDRVVFHADGSTYSLPAKMGFSGSVYASLRAKGYVSKDMEIIVDAQGVYVFVDGCSYRINGNNELVPCEE